MRRRTVNVDPRLTESEKRGFSHSINPFKAEIIEYLKVLGSDTTMNPKTIDNQPEINWLMRPYIIDLLIEMHSFFKLNQETLFLASFIADKYCSRRIVYKKHYQLLIAVSLWIAAKFKDVKRKIPTLKELFLFCHKIYEPCVFLQMEKHVLNTLEWSVGNLVTTYDMLQAILSSADEIIPKDPELRELASFFCYLSLYQRNYLCYSSSTKAITALLIASCILSKDNFSSYLVQLMVFSPKKNDICFNDPKFYKVNDDDFYEHKYFFDQKSQDVNSLSSIICSQKLNDIRNCFHLFLNDIFHEKLSDDKELVSYTLLKKFGSLPVRRLLESYKLQNIVVYTNICLLKDTLHHANIDYETDLLQFQCKESIFSYIDRLAGFRNRDGTLLSLHLPLTTEEDFLFASPTTLLPTLDEYATSQETSFSKHTLPNIQNFLTPEINTTIFSLQNASSQNSYPSTPYSLNSCFSGRPRLSISSTSSSSISCSTNSIVSPAGLLKKSFRSNSRYSPSHFQPTLSRKSSIQSDIFELVNK